MEGKKAFVVYTNWKQYRDDLTDEEVGMWTRWMFDYCNDKWIDKEDNDLKQDMVSLNSYISKRDNSFSTATKLVKKGLNAASSTIGNIG